MQSREKNTTGLVAWIGNHTVETGSTLRSLTAVTAGAAEFYAVVKGCQVGLALRPIYQDLGIPMKVEIQSGSSTANSLTDRFGSRTTNETTLIRGTVGYKKESKMENSVSRRCLQRNIVQMLARSQSLLQYNATMHVCKIGILLTMYPTLGCEKMGRQLNRAYVGGG